MFQTFPRVAARLAACYHLDHPTKGPIAGPWSKLNSASLRRLGLNVAKVWLEWDESGKLCEAVDKAVNGSDRFEKEYWDRVTS